MEKIILASQSPRRSQLLQWAEIPYEVIIANADENYPDNLPPHEVAQHIANNKAIAVQKKILKNHSNGNDYTIIAADTIVVLGNRIIGKPSGRDEAVDTLMHLSGKTHSVITGVCILRNDLKKNFLKKHS